MNNLSSYCGLFNAKTRASDKDLPVTKSQIAQWDQKKSEVAFTFFSSFALFTPLRKARISGQKS